MIIELSEKYNINSKYTSFITVYERKDKLLEVSKYQETKLSNKFAEDALMNNIWDMFGMDECEEKCCDMYLPSFQKSRSSSNRLNNVNISCSLRENKEVKSESKTLELKIDEYYEVFVSQNEKSILTFLLYAIYYLRKKKNKFNYNDLLRFLKNHKQEVLENELYLKLLCLCYKQLEDNRFIDKKETMELMDDNFRKIVETNLKISVEFKELSEDEINTIVESNKVIENIDKVIEHFIAANYS